MSPNKTLSRLFPFFLVLYEISIYLSNDAYLPVLPHMGAALNTSAEWLPFTLTVWFLGAASTQLIMGSIADRFGRRRTLLCGGIVYVFSLILCGLSTQLLPFLIARFLQGAMAASMVAAGYSTIHDSYDQKKAIKLLAWMGAISLLAPALGPLVGSGILAFGSWHWIFFSLAGLAALSLIAHSYVMPETTTEKNQKADPIASYLQLIRSWRFMGQAFAASAMIFGVIAWVASGPWIVHTQFKEPGYYFGIYQAIILTGFFIGSQLVKLLMRRFTLRQLVVFCLFLPVVVSAAAFFTSHYSLMQSSSFIGAMFIIAICLGVAFPVLNRLTIEASDAPMGARVSMFATTGTIAAVISSIAVQQSLPITTAGLSLILLAGAVASVVLYISTKPFAKR